MGGRGERRSLVQSPEVRLEGWCSGGSRVSCGPRLAREVLEEVKKEGVGGGLLSNRCEVAERWTGRKQAKPSWTGAERRAPKGCFWKKHQSYVGQTKFGGVGLRWWLLGGGTVSGVSSPTSFDCGFALPFGHSCGVSICASLDSRPWPKLRGNR